LLHADDLAVTAENEEELIKKFNRRKDGVESKGMKVDKAAMGYRMLEDGHVVSVVEVLVETQYRVVY